MDMEMRTFTPRTAKLLGVGPDEFAGVATDGTLDHMGDIVDPLGGRLDVFRSNPVIQAQHDPNRPVARAQHIGYENGRIELRAKFPPEGTSAAADECRRLVKAGILNGLSIGFIPNAWKPLKEGGYRYTDWTLLEVSVCSVPANPAALITERSMRQSRTGQRGAGAGMGTADDQRALRRLRASAVALRRAAMGTVALRAVGHRRLSQLQRRAAELRKRSELPDDPRIIAADAAFRLRSW